MKQRNVLILGSGVAGLTTARELLVSALGHKVTIWSKESPGELPQTSGNAYALWVPYKDDLDPRIEGWTDQSLKAFKELSAEQDTGVALRNIYNLQTAVTQPWYERKYHCFRHARKGEIPAQYADAWVLESAPVIDPKRYLPWLKSEVARYGGCFENREVTSIDLVPPAFDTIINCTGGGAEALVGDKEFSPLNLQVVVVKNNGFDRVVVDDVGPNAMACVVPHGDYIKLGALMDELDQSKGDFVDDLATIGILERCSRLMPGFEVSAKDVVEVIRSARPNRARPRVETEIMTDGRTLIHNYGHGSTGYITSHGVANTIAQILDQ